MISTYSMSYVCQNQKGRFYLLTYLTGSNLRFAYLSLMTTQALCIICDVFCLRPIKKATDNYLHDIYALLFLSFLQYQRCYDSVVCNNTM